MSEITIQPIPPYDDLVPITPAEAADWMTRHGRVMLITMADGSRWRVLEPWEDGSAPDWPLRLADTA